MNNESTHNLLTKEYLSESTEKHINFSSQCFSLGSLDLHVIQRVLKI